MTHKRVVTVVISIWVISAFLSFMTWAPPTIRSLFLSISTVIGLLLITLGYIKIYLTVRRHKNHIQAVHFQPVTQNGETANFVKIVKSTVSVFYIYLVFLICYLPILMSSAAFAILGPSITLKRLFLFSLTFIFLNSTLNPIVYCWKMKHVRHAIMDILQNMSWFRNLVSF